MNHLVNKYAMFCLVLGMSIQSCVLFQGPVNGKDNPINNNNNHGLTGDGQFYWGTLTITPLDKNRSRITRSIESVPFYSGMVGKEFVSGRIHENTDEYPDGTENYFPGLVTCRYARVIQVEDDRNVIVDFAFNGGNVSSPQVTAQTDGYFFTDNRKAFKDLIENPTREEIIILDDDRVYVIKGMPQALLAKPIHFRRSGTGNHKPVIMLSVEDAFNMGKKGSGNSPSYAANFGGSNFILLDDNDYACTFTNIDISPTIYTIPTVQYGRSYANFFKEIKVNSSQKRLCRISNCNIDVLKQRAISQLGSERSGMTWDMPILGYSMNGGIETNGDVSDLTRYELINTSWRAHTVMNLKSKDRAGVLFKVVGADENSPVQLVENLAVKETSYENVPLSFSVVNGHTEITSLSSAFSWYLVTNQDWNGGTSTNHKTFNRISVFVNDVKYVLYMHNHADFRELGVGDIAVKNGQTARMFDVIAQKGDQLTTWQKGYKTGVLRIIDSQTVDVWGTQLVKGDVLKHNGHNYQINTVEYRTKDKSLTDHFIHYWRISLTGPPITATNPQFEVTESKLEPLLNGQPYNCRVFVNRDPHGHLFYTDGGVNMHFKNVETYGYWRSSSGGTGQPESLAKATQIAYFKNVVTHDGGCIGKEWRPAFMAYREQQQGSNYRLTIDGGNTEVWQTTTGGYHVSYKNKPVLRGRLISPVNGDTLGFTSNEEAGEVMITLQDGDYFSIKNVKGQSIRLKAFGTCTLNVDGYEGAKVDRQGFEHRMYGIYIVNANSTTKLYIEGSGGKAPIRCTSRDIKSSDQLIINLSNWQRNTEYYTDKFLSLPFSSAGDPNFTQNIQVTNQNGEPINLD
jgi:hypothetical protein